LKTCIDNININYSVNGQGEDTLLLLHGWDSNITLFKNIIEHFSKTKKIYALDMPGFGESQEQDEPWDVDKYVDFVIKFIKKMGITTFSALGHSFGGRVIIKMVNKKDLPFNIEKIVLVDSAGILPKKTKKKSLKTTTYKVCKKIVSNKIVSKIMPNALENLKKHFGSEDYKNATPILRQTLVKVVNEDLESLLPNIKQPTLLIWGDKDTATPLEDAKTMEKLIPDAGLVIIKGAGHYSFLEQPYFVNKVLDSFL